MENDAFTEVYRQYHRLIYRSVFAQTGNQELAEDISQQVMLKYFEHMPEVEKGYEKGWLLTVERHLLIDYYRKNHNLKAIREEEMKEAVNRSVFPDPGKDVERRQFLVRILEALRLKNEDWYDVMYLVCALEISEPEAAKQLGISIGLLRTRLYRARKYLQKLFGDDYKSI